MSVAFAKSLRIIYTPCSVHAHHDHRQEKESYIDTVVVIASLGQDAQKYSEEATIRLRAVMSRVYPALVPLKGRGTGHSQGPCLDLHWSCQDVMGRASRRIATFLRN